MVNRRRVGYAFAALAHKADSGLCPAQPAAGCENGGMRNREVDAYIDALAEPKRSTLSRLRDDIAALLPRAEECISYGMPGFRLDGKMVAGFSAFKNHLSYLPHSGSVLSKLDEAVSGYDATKGSLHFPIDKPLPKKLVKQLIDVRLREIAEKAARR